jgi:hypothetical protein
MSWSAMRWAAPITSGIDGAPLSTSAKTVLLILAEMAGARSNACWPSVATLAARSCIAERTARTALRELEQRGLIRAEIAAGRRTSRYTLDVSNPASRAGFKKRSTRQQPPGSTRQQMPLNPATDDTQPGNCCPSTRQQMPPNREKNRSRNREENTHTARETRAERVPSADPDFEQFWQRYPRKVGKGQARRAFATALRKTSLTDMLRALDRARWPDDPRFVPHPATWLNGERWSDDPKAVASSVPPRRQHDTAADRMRALFPDGIADDPFGGTTVETTFTEERPDD